MREPAHPAREELELTRVLHALSDPTRLEVVRTVAQQAGGPCCQLETGVAKSTLSHHLRVLRQAGVIRVRIDGTAHRLCLRRDDLDARFPGLLNAILSTL